MHIAFFTDSPTKTTGFGVACHEFARELSAFGANVTCLSLGLLGNVDYSRYPYKLWAGRRAADLGHYFKDHRPDVVILLGPITNIADAIEIARKVLPTRTLLVAHVASEGLPVSVRYTGALRSVHAVFAPTNALAHHLSETHGIFTSVVPYGLNLALFKPLKASQKNLLRRALGLESAFLLGVFGRNTYRKQQPRVLEALHLLRTRDLLNDIYIYFHCEQLGDASFEGWDLQELAAGLGLANRVVFSSRFSQEVGYIREGIIPSVPDQIDNLGYIYRLGICDMVVNPSFAGGFEYASVEAQACGVPLAVTNDYGNMTEVAGEAAVLLDGNPGTWTNGARQYFVDPSTIASAVLRVRNNPSTREQLVERGLTNVQRFSSKHVGRLLLERLQLLCEGSTPSEPSSAGTVID